MPLSWDTEGDFDAVVDTLESVTLLRCGRAENAEAFRAWRFSETVVESGDSLGVLRRVDVVWHTQYIAGELPPRPGDVVVDEADERCVVHSVNLLRGGTRYVCQSRRTEFAEGRGERFDVERAITEDSSEGTVLIGWRVTRPGVQGWFDTPPAPGVASEGTQVRVLLLEPFAIEPGDRLRRHRGGVYEVLSHTPPASLGEAWVVVAEAVAEA